MTVPTVRTANVKAASVPGFREDAIQALTDFVAAVVTGMSHLKSILPSTFRYPTNTKIFVKCFKDMPRDSCPFF